jgi:hypothetical protein
MNTCYIIFIKQNNNVTNEVIDEFIKNTTFIHNTICGQAFFKLRVFKEMTTVNVLICKHPYQDHFLRSALQMTIIPEINKLLKDYEDNIVSFITTKVLDFGVFGSIQNKLSIDDVCSSKESNAIKE